jgi:hypothetical protein
MKRAKNPMRRSWLDDTEGGWIPHRLRLLVSPAWRYRPKPLARILERLEIEHLTHGGAQNGHLAVSYAQFISYGVSRKAIRPALSAGVPLGLLEVIQTDEWVGDIRAPNEYRLTYVPSKDRRAPTDEWLGVTEAQAKAIAFAAAGGPADQLSECEAVAS